MLEKKTLDDIIRRIVEVAQPEKMKKQERPSQRWSARLNN
jgi:hypothetical protein